MANSVLDPKALAQLKHLQSEHPQLLIPPTILPAITGWAQFRIIAMPGRAFECEFHAAGAAATPLVIHTHHGWFWVPRNPEAAGMTAVNFWLFPLESNDPTRLSVSSEADGGSFQFDVSVEAFVSGDVFSIRTIKTESPGEDFGLFLYRDATLALAQQHVGAVTTDWTNYTLM